MNCPTCEMPLGRCVHTTEGQVTIGRGVITRAQALREFEIESLPRLSEHDVADEYIARSGTIGQPPVTLISARPQPTDAVACTAPVASEAAGGTGSNKPRAHLYDPKCHELAEYFGRDRHDRDLTDEEIDELAHDIQLCVEGYISLLDSEGL